MGGNRRVVRNVRGVLVCAGLLVSVAQAGVVGTVWVEVDNSEGTVGEAAGVATELAGVRTFDLYALLTPGTEIYVADFGFVGATSEYRPMRTTQEVYQNPFGGDTQSDMIGSLPTAEFAALEFDTSVGIGLIDAKVVRNATILGANWSLFMFQAAWYVYPTGRDSVTPAQGDVFGRLFLARVSVTSERSFGDYAPDAEYLGGAFYIGGKDRAGDIGLEVSREGVIQTRNAFAGPEPLFFEPNPDGYGGVNPDNDFETWTPRVRFSGDLDYDLVVDADELAILRGAYGTINPLYDMNGDLLIEEHDIRLMVFLVDGTIPEVDAAPTPKAQKKAVKRYERS